MVCAYCQNAHGLKRYAQKLLEVQDAVLAQPVADRVLHEGVGDDDEVAREPRAQRQGDGRREVPPRAEPLLAEEEQPEERRLEEEGEHALHRQRLADDLAGVAGEPGPVGAELELHRDAGHDAHGEVEGEDPGPEPGDLVVRLVAEAQRERLEQRR